MLTAVGLGMFVASVSYSLRHVLGALPDRDPVSAQAASAAASVLLPGVIVLAMAPSPASDQRSGATTRRLATAGRCDSG